MRKKIFSFFLTLFGLKKNRVDVSKKGTIIILIDGLSFSALTQAISKGFCPTFKKLSTHSYTLSKYYCGLPAATTATEALLFYGNNYNIPGFTWYDRKLNMFVRGNRSYELAQFEDMYPKKRNLLQKGSAIMSVYTGGATQLSVSGRNLAFSKSFGLLQTFHYLFMTLLYPVQLIRTLYLTVKTIIFYKPSKRSSVVDIFSRIILGQFSCFLTEIEIIRNTKTIFVDFLLYDEYAHIHGPTHPVALSTLRLIDRYIKRIIHTASQSEQKYDVILLSDHGQTESIPWDKTELKSIKHITEALNNSNYIVQKTYGGFTSFKSNQLYVVPAGSTLQLYFSDYLKTAVTEQSLHLQFPGIIERLLTYPEFGWVLVRQSDNSAKLYGKKGSLTISSNSSVQVIGTPFPNMSATEIDKLCKSLVAYSTFPNNGDLTLFGSVIDSKVISFEQHKGTHGGFYGAMVHPFIMTKRKDLIGKSMTEIFDTIALSI